MVTYTRTTSTTNPLLMTFVKRGLGTRTIVHRHVLIDNYEKDDHTFSTGIDLNDNESFSAARSLLPTESTPGKPTRPHFSQLILCIHDAFERARDGAEISREEHSSLSDTDVHDKIYTYRLVSPADNSQEGLRPDEKFVSLKQLSKLLQNVVKLESANSGDQLPNIVLDSYITAHSGLKETAEEPSNAIELGVTVRQLTQELLDEIESATMTEFAEPDL